MASEVLETPVPSDLARKLLNKDFANLIQRVQRGGKLSRTERSMLQNMSVGSTPEAGPLLVKNFGAADVDHANRPSHSFVAQQV